MNQAEFEQELERPMTNDDFMVLEMLMSVKDMCIIDVATQMECSVKQAFDLVLPMWQLYLIWYPQTHYYIGLTDKGRTLYQDAKKNFKGVGDF